MTYILKDENSNITKEKYEGGFYEKELLKTKYKDKYLADKVVRRKGYFVKSQNSRTSAKDILKLENLVFQK